MLFRSGLHASAPSLLGLPLSTLVAIQAVLMECHVQTNQFLAYGALVGGPQSDDTFEDSRGWCCAAYNEVAIDYNAGFTGAIARLVDYYKDQKLFSDCTLDLGWDHVNATIVSHPLQSPALLALTSTLCEEAQPLCESYLACPSGV